MSDFFSPENDDDQFARFGELENLDNGKSNKWQAATVVSVVVTVLVVVAVVAGGYFYSYPMLKSNLNKQGLSDKIAGSAADDKIVQDLNNVNGSLQKEVELKPVSNILMVGVESVGGKQLARGLLVGRFDLQKKNIQAINISERTYYNIDGLGLDQINKVYSMGMTATKQTLQGLLRVPIDGHVVLDYNDFQFMVSENSFRVGFSKAIELSYTNDEKKAFMKAISSMDPSKSNILPLPVQYILSLIHI
jgi:anionic cell wall polymer biosynthesis LytR-Cps2A-Psr (LCP) family protein